MCRVSQMSMHTPRFSVLPCSCHVDLTAGSWSLHAWRDPRARTHLALYQLFRFLIWRGAAHMVCYPISAPAAAAGAC